MWRNRAAFRPPFLELLDGADVDARVVLVDAWTSVGGSQFVDSSGTGRYHTSATRSSRSSTPATTRTASAASPGRRRDGDAAPRPLPGLRESRRRGSLRGLDPPLLPAGGAAPARRLRWLDRAFPGRARNGPAPLAHPHDLHVLLQWGFSAAYSADADGTIRLPYDTATAEVIPELWERRLEWDYPTLVPRHADALRGLRAI